MAERAPWRLADAISSLARRELSATEALDRCLDRVEAAQDAGAFVLVDDARARAAAAALDRRGRRGPLHGIPVAVKDLIDVEGLPTAAGRRAAGRTARRDAAIVARLRAAGAIVVGKTRTDEIGLSTVTPGARDPWEPRRSVGGSSGGSAIAVAVGACLIGLGTDTAGSCRIPAAALGLAGLCPAPRSLPRTGVVPLSPSHDRVGFITPDVEGLAILWRALVGGSPRPPRRVATFSAEALGRVPSRWARDAGDAARRLGRPVASIDSPAPRAFAPARGVVVVAEAAALHRASEAEHPAIREQLRAGALISEAELSDARQELARLSAQLRAVLAGDAVAVLPTLPQRPPLHADLRDAEDELRAVSRLTRFCGPANSAGIAALTVPWPGVDAGVQVLAQSTSVALGAGRLLETDVLTETPERPEAVPCRT